MNLKIDPGLTIKKVNSLLEEIEENKLTYNQGSEEFKRLKQEVEGLLRATFEDYENRIGKLRWSYSVGKTNGSNLIEITKNYLISLKSELNLYIDENQYEEDRFNEDTKRNLIFILTIIIWITIAIITLTYLYDLSGIRIILDKEQQNIYSFYGSSAQAIATFIAFIIAGYALVYQAMDNLENRDDTLIKIHNEIKKEHHNKIKILSITTGLAIISSLMILWFNKFNFYLLKITLMSIADVFSAITIVGAIWLVISITDPDKIGKISDKLREKFEKPEMGDHIFNIVEEPLFKKEKEEAKPSEGFINKYEFVTNFINLEVDIMNILDISDIPLKPLLKFSSFKEMINALRDANVLPYELYLRLNKINDYRNLVIHGRNTEKVDKWTVDEIKKLREELIKIINEKGYYLCYQKPGKGSYLCIKCENKLYLDNETDVLKPCKHCNECIFYRYGSNNNKNDSLITDYKLFDNDKCIEPSKYNSTDQKVKTWYNKGITLRSVKKYNESIEYFERILEIEPDNVESLTNIGLNLISLKMFEKSLMYFEKALEIEPNSSKIWNSRGYAFEKLGKHENALICFYESLKIDSNNFEAWYLRGVSLEKVGRLEEALRCYEESLKLRSNFEPALKSKEEILELLKK